jgi:HEAT repeat protein
LNAVDALKKLGWQPSKDETGAWFWISQGDKYIEKCVEIGAPAIEPLITTLKYSHNDLTWLAAQRAAAIALGIIGDTRAVEPLISALSDSDNHVRLAAAEALGKIGDVRAIEPLVAVLNDGFVRDNAEESLKKLGWKPAITPTSNRPPA